MVQRNIIKKVLAISIITASLNTHAGPKYQPDIYFYNLKEAALSFEKYQNEILAKPDLTTDPDLTNYLQSGITLSNAACDAWLTELGKAEQQTSFFKNVMNIVGNLILGVAGINGADSNSLARGSLGLVAANAGIDAYKSDILLGSIGPIRTKVLEGRKLSETLLLANPPVNRYHAQRRLIEYHSTCTTAAVIQLLQDSLANSKFIAPDSSLSSATGQSKATGLVIKLHDLLFPKESGQFNTDNLYGLYLIKIADVNISNNFTIPYKNSPYLKIVDASWESKDPETQIKATKMLQEIADDLNFPARLNIQIANEDILKKAEAERLAAEKQAEIKKDEINKSKHSNVEKQKEIKIEEAKLGIVQDAITLKANSSISIPTPEVKLISSPVTTDSIIPKLVPIDSKNPDKQ